MNDAAKSTARGNRPTLLTSSFALVMTAGAAVTASTPAFTKRRLAASSIPGVCNSRQRCSRPACLASAFAVSSVRVVKSISPPWLRRGRCSRRKPRVSLSTLSKIKSQAPEPATWKSSSQRRAAVNLAVCSLLRRSGWPTRSRILAKP